MNTKTKAPQHTTEEDTPHVHHAGCGHDHTPQTFVREGEKVGRNDQCPCGSGKKYKKCCLA